MLGMVQKKNCIETPQDVTDVFESYFNRFHVFSSRAQIIRLNSLPRATGQNEVVYR